MEKCRKVLLVLLVYDISYSMQHHIPIRHYQSSAQGSALVTNIGAQLVSLVIFDSKYPAECSYKPTKQNRNKKEKQKQQYKGTPRTI